MLKACHGDGSHNPPYHGECKGCPYVGEVCTQIPCDIRERKECAQCNSPVCPLMGDDVVCTRTDAGGIRLSPCKKERGAMERVCVWPDGTWCHWSELGEYGWKSDDFEVVSVSTDLDDEDIDVFVAER